MKIDDEDKQTPGDIIVQASRDLETCPIDSLRTNTLFVETYELVCITVQNFRLVRLKVLTPGCEKSGDGLWRISINPFGIWLDELCRSLVCSLKSIGLPYVDVRWLCLVSYCWVVAERN